MKCIIFSDYFYQRQPQEEIRSYYIGVKMEELYKTLRLQIARGLLFCSCMSEEEATAQAEELTLHSPLHAVHLPTCPLRTSVF